MELERTSATMHHPIGGIHDGGRGPIVLLEPNDGRILVEACETQQVVRRRTGERVDGLARIADDTDIVAFTEPLRQQFLLQWGDVLCFKVGTKIFALLNLDAVPPRLMFKCDPEKFAELVEQEDIIPAPHFGRYNWVSFLRLDALPWSDVKELIELSYGMVAAKAKVGETKTAKPKAIDRRNTKARRAR